MFNLPKTLINNGLLTCPIPYDESILAKLERPFPQQLLWLTEKNLREEGDRELLVNSELAMKGVTSDHISKQKLLLSAVVPTTRKTARVLFHLGLKPKDIVQVSLPNTTEFFYPICATWLCGGIISPVDPAFDATAVGLPLADTNPKIIICCQANKDAIVSALQTANKLQDTKVVVVDFDKEATNDHNIISLESLMQKADEFPDPPEDLNNDINDVCAVIWSSGTTSRPKGVQVTYAHFTQYLRPVRVLQDKRVVLTQRFCHTTGISLPIMCITSNMVGYFFCDPAREQNEGLEVLRAIDRFKADTLFGTGCLLLDLCHRKEIPKEMDLSSITLVTPVGTNVPGEVFTMLKRQFPNLKDVPNYYGCTELGTAVTISNTTKNLGYVAPGNTVKIVDPETNKICGPNQVGEILVKGPIHTPGYYNRPELNAKLFTEDGFMRTGDLSHYDEEAVLHFDGRCKELLKYREFDIYPLELESIIAKHPGVQEVCVFERSDSVQIELITAAIVKKEGAEFDEAEIIEMMEKEVADCKRLRGGVWFVQTLPRNSMGKLTRRYLQVMYTQQFG